MTEQCQTHGGAMPVTAVSVSPRGSVTNAKGPATEPQLARSTSGNAGSGPVAADQADPAAAGEVGVEGDGGRSGGEVGVLAAAADTKEEARRQRPRQRQGGGANGRASGTRVASSRDDARAELPAGKLFTRLKIYLTVQTILCIIHNLLVPLDLRLK